LRGRAKDRGTMGQDRERGEPSSVMLIVENDVLKRTATAADFRGKGFEVFEAADVAEAKTVLRAIVVDVLYSNVSLVDRRQLARWVQQQHLSLRMLCSTDTDAQASRQERPRNVVLVVEHDVLLRLAIASDLRRAGIQVLEAANTADAVIILDSIAVDALISDVNTEGQITGIREHEAVAETGNLRRKHGISKALYKSKAKSDGPEVQEAKRPRALEHENRRLKKLLAETMLDNAMLKDIASKQW
jgi:putative transposase